MCTPNEGLVSVQSHYPIISTSQRHDTFPVPTSTLSFTALEVLIGYYSVSHHLQPQLALGLISMATETLPAVMMGHGNASSLMKRWKGSAKEGKRRVMVRIGGDQTFKHHEK